MSTNVVHRDAIASAATPKSARSGHLASWLARMVDWCRRSNHGLPPTDAAMGEAEAFSRSRGL